MTTHLKRTSLVLCFVLASCVATSPETPPQSAASLNRIQHIVVIYAENRSFDNLYGLFPGASGISSATPATWTQSDRDGTPLATLPPVWKSGPTPDPAYPAQMPNRPFRIDGSPINQAPAVATRDLIHRFYTNQEQINGGRLDRYAAMSDAGGLVMGYYDGSSLPLWKIARDYTLADNFFMGAFGGSFLNHIYLVCACAPVFPNAPPSLVAALDANGRLALKPNSPASALAGPPQYVNDGAVTPDGFGINTLQPPYQPSSAPPAPGGDSRFADPAKNPLPAQTLKTVGDTLSDKGIDWAWYAEAWQVALADGMQPPGAARKVIDNAGAGRRISCPTISPSIISPGTRRAQRSERSTSRTTTSCSRRFATTRCLLSPSTNHKGITTSIRATRTSSPATCTSRS